MTIEIPDNKLKNIIAHLDDTEEPPSWMIEIGKAINDAFDNEIKVTFENAIDKCFFNIQESMGIEDGGVTPDLDIKFDKAKDEFIKYCVEVIRWQLC